MSIAEPLPTGGAGKGPLIFWPDKRSPEAQAAINAAIVACESAAVNTEIRLRAEEADRQHEQTKKWQEWKAALAEAARVKKFGPPKPFPRLADQTDGSEYWAIPSDQDKPHYREHVLVEELTEKRESDYVEHCMNTAGFIMPADSYQKSLKRRFTRFDQSTRLSLALVEGGARQPECRKNAPSICTFISRKEIKLPIIPRVNFLPESAASRRAPMLKEVEHFAARHPLARMSTFTAGQRCPTPEIRERTSAFTRKLSRLNSERWFKHYAAILFRAVEFGTPKICPKSFQWLWHIHAHTILKPHRFHKRKKWQKFCGKVAVFMGAHWDCGRPIDDAREVVKYPVKPADLEKVLSSVGGVSTICELYRQTLKMRLVETLGSLRAARQSLKNTKRHRLKERNAEGEWLPATRRKWNSHGRSVTKAAIRAKRKQKAAVVEFREGMDNLAGYCALPEPTPAAPKMINRIVARLAPAPFASRVYEPAAFVWNFDGNWDAILGHHCVQRAVEAVRPQVELSLELLAAAERRATGADNSSHQSRNCPEPFLEFPPPDPLKLHLAALAT